MLKFCRMSAEKYRQNTLYAYVLEELKPAISSPYSFKSKFIYCMEENTAPKHFEVGEIGRVSKADFAKFR